MGRTISCAGLAVLMAPQVAVQDESAQLAFLMGTQVGAQEEIAMRRSC